MKLKLHLCLALVSLSLTTHARGVRLWSDAELQNASDVIFIGSPIAVKDLDETDSLGWPRSVTSYPVFRGVETTFKVSRVLQGKPENDQIVLHHYRVEWEAPANGPVFISFTPNSTNEYLLYLVRDGANRYAPVAGQVDASLSIKSMATNVPGQSVPPVPVPAALADADPSVHAVAKVKLKFVSVDSEETDGQDGYGKNAVDGNPNTYWHTQWHDQSPGLPHDITIELLPPSVIKGFTYLPRQDESDHGIIKDYEFYVSDDGRNFGQPVKKGAFGPITVQLGTSVNAESGREIKTETFEPIKCRFIKLRAISEINGLPWTSAAEIGVIL